MQFDEARDQRLQVLVERRRRHDLQRSARVGQVEPGPMPEYVREQDVVLERQAVKHEALLAGRVGRLAGARCSDHRR